jgi:hypothetical protein
VEEPCRRQRSGSAAPAATPWCPVPVDRRATRPPPLRGFGTAPTPMAAGASCGPGAASPRGCASPLASPPLAPRAAACARRSAGASKSPRGALGRATKRRSHTGATRSGRPSIRDGGTATTPLLPRGVGLFSPATCRAHRCPRGAHANPAGLGAPRPPRRQQGDIT